MAGIIVTGVVHFVLLRPLLDLNGADWAADKLLHMAVPALAVVGWALFGPRPRIEGRDIGWALVWPVAWLVWTLVVGGLTGWYPYPFLDHHEEHGVPGVVVSIVAITAFFLVVLWLARLVDQRIHPRRRRGTPTAEVLPSHDHSRGRGDRPRRPPSGTGCAECDPVGGWWVHLRRCAQCGHIGCCDTSPAQHATAHFRATGHPVIQSFEPGEDWFWDFRTDEPVDGPELAPPRRAPRGPDRARAGRAGCLPTGVSTCTEPAPGWAGYSRAR